MVKKIISSQTHEIRRKILRDNDPLVSVEFDGDFNETTIHLGCFKDDELCGILTLIELEKGIFQMRGMAVLEEHQGKGVGREIIEFTEELLNENQIQKIVLNARIKAVGFYQKLGYEVVSDEFEIPTVGIHLKMEKKLNSMN